MEKTQITASVCTIGDEILIGQIVDTNSSAIATVLNEIGVKVRRMISIADDREQILTSLDLLKCLLYQRLIHGHNLR